MNEAILLPLFQKKKKSCSVTAVLCLLLAATLLASGQRLRHLLFSGAASLHFSVAAIFLPASQYHVALMSVWLYVLNNVGIFFAFALCVLLDGKWTLDE
jgi:hypothetical protein